MPLTRAAALAGAVLLLAPTGASAQGSTQGTERQRMACMTDAMTLCAADVPNARRIERCLRRNYASVSAPCQGELDAAGTATPGGAPRQGY